ncbi:MAG TPA: hypothetical protein VHQ22_14825 [Terriglobales bacterium]|nr:hypothetical protein [Terriglobales bacterium]
MSVRAGWTLLVVFASLTCCAQSPPQQKIFSAPVSKVQAALKNISGGTSGPLPVLDGFVVAGRRKLDAYRRPYYQCSVKVTPASSGGSLVRVAAKITAWNSDPAHSGYEVLQSNGRLESDLLDRLQDQLTSDQEGTSTTTASSSSPHTGTSHAPESPAPEISAPMPQFPSASAMNTPPSPNTNEQDAGLEQEARSLEQLIKNQSHPTNLIAVKQDQTPVLQDPSSDAKVLFLASAEDEFEILDINPEWAHVRISGLSRGWLRRASVEMLDGSETVADAQKVAPAPERQSAKEQSLSSALFSVTGEEDGSFPGDWAPLKGKTVKIISIQQATGTGRISSPQDKMQFAEDLFTKEGANQSSAGLVLIFDAEDGGIVAATRAVVDEWKKGSLTEQALWKQCYLDPPEILGASD